MHLPSKYSCLKFVGHLKSLPRAGAAGAVGVMTAAELLARGPTSIQGGVGVHTAGALATKLFTRERGCGLALRAWGLPLS